MKLIISKLLHLLFEIQIKINLILFENKGTSQSKINYIYLLSQALLCENNQKVSKKIISDILMFIKLLNIKKILSTNNLNLADIKQKLIDTIKNIELSITLNFNTEFEIKKINEILQILNVKMTKLLNFKEINNLLKILPQVTSKKLKNFLFLSGCSISWYYPSIQSLYKNLTTFATLKPPEKFLLKSRKQYIKIADAFYNIIGIPQKSFIDFGENWDLVEKEELYDAIILDDINEYFNYEERTKIVLNHRQNTGKETPRKIRKNSVSKIYKKNRDKKRKKSKLNSNIVINENNKEKDKIKYNKLLKIKKIKINPEELADSSNISENEILYLNKTVRKIIYNRFIHNIFLFIEKGKENTFKIYSISNNNNKNNKNVEVILLNPIFNV